MILSAEKLATAETCLRRYFWTERYTVPRVSLMGALYRSIDAGLRSENPERAAENEFLSLAASPGLDVTGGDVYSSAMHHAKLSGIISVALRSASTGPWTAWPEIEVGNPTRGVHRWRSACYDTGDGVPRRVVLVDRWSDDRKQEEMRGWRTLGECCALHKPVMVTAVTVGSARELRRISPWTRCYRHPRNRVYRFKRKSAAEDFGANWNPLWREDSGILTADWLTRMQKDGCMEELVNTARVEVPGRWQDYMREICRLAHEMETWTGNQSAPPMRLAGCYDFTRCAFVGVCHGAAPPVPETHGFRVKL